MQFCLVCPENEFSVMLRGFLEKHYHHFEETDENKFIYTDIFRQYVSGESATLWEPAKSLWPHPTPLV